MRLLSPALVNRLYHTSTQQSFRTFSSYGIFSSQNEIRLAQKMKVMSSNCLAFNKSSFSNRRTIFQNFINRSLGSSSGVFQSNDESKTIKMSSLAEEKLKETQANILEDIKETKAVVKERMEAIVERENILTVPNLLCAGRLAAAPVLAHLIVSGQMTPALALFVAAGVTDVLDGWIARTFPSQASRFGSFLDPLADKVLVATVVLSLAYAGLIPGMLTFVIVYRDVGIIAAASHLRYRSLPKPRTLARYFDASHATVQLAPTALSKANTAIQLALISMTLAGAVWPIAQCYYTAMWFVTTVSTISSGAWYLFSPDTYHILSQMQEEAGEQESSEESRQR